MTRTREDITAEVAAELGKCRQRGIEGLDHKGHNQEPVEAPELTRLAEEYATAKGLSAAGRTPRIKALLRDALPAYEKGGQQDSAQLIRELFFGDSQGEVKKKAGELLEDAMKKRGESDEDKFRIQRQTAFRFFAQFLLDFVEQAKQVGTPVVKSSQRSQANGGKRKRQRQGFSAAAVLVVLAGGGAAWWGFEHGGSPMTQGLNPPVSSLGSPPASNTPPSGDATGTTYKEIAGAAKGANTYDDPYTLVRTGQKIPFLTEVEVTCKVNAPTMPSVTYWYRVATPPWDNGYYAPANSFLNGDSPEGPYSHDLDPAVPDCPPIGQS